jgi:hypothetical protein
MMWDTRFDGDIMQDLPRLIRLVPVSPDLVIASAACGGRLQPLLSSHTEAIGIARGTGFEVRSDTRLHPDGAD